MNFFGTYMGNYTGVFFDYTYTGGSYVKFFGIYFNDYFGNYFGEIPEGKPRWYTLVELNCRPTIKIELETRAKLVDVNTRT